MKTLFLFTNTFPCDNSLEHYIEYELPFLSKKFDKIIIIPGDFGKTKVPIPSNVEVINIYSHLYFQNSIWRLIKSIPLLLSILSYEFFHTRISKLYWIKQLPKSLYTLYNAIEAASALDLIRKEKKLSLNETFFYSYWLYHSSLILAVAKRKGYIDSFISRGHQADVYEEANKYKNLFKSYKLKYINKLFLISDHAKNYLLKKYPQHAEKYITAYLGVKDNGLNPHNNKEFTILSCSKYAEHKRVHLIPQILSLVNFPITWIHIGDGPKFDKQLVEYALSKCGSNVSIHFPGYIRNHDLPKEYKKQGIDVFLNVSSLEGLSVAVMEAISYGITVIATDVNATNEVANEQSGYIVPIDFMPGDIASILQDLKSGIKPFKNDGARELFEEKFNAAKNFERFIEQIIN